MTPQAITAFDLAQRYIGIAEMAGSQDHPLIQWWLSLCGLPSDTHDEIAWCSAFVNGIAWELRLPRSKSAAARSWLAIGKPVTLDQAEAGFDVLVLKRGGGQQPGADRLDAPGHVGFFAGIEKSATSPLPQFVQLLGGNQGNRVCIERFPIADLLGVRRLV